MIRYFVLACSVCTGDPKSDLTRGALAGVFFLGVIVAGVLAAIASTAIVWTRRARRLHHPL